ncbi:MAG TPA: hypothetical protein VJQ82_07005, partial [Terriglobales bacterium]|nr:hypothetical protein [Terriglobales bacterium]
MPMQPFGRLFPQLEKDESRVIWLPDGADGIPADRYALFEYYCDERKCNCRRVLLNLRCASSARSV